MNECVVFLAVYFLVQCLTLFAGHFTVSPSNGVKAIDNFKLEGRIANEASDIVQGLDGNNIVRCKSHLVDQDSLKIWEKLDIFTFPLQGVEQAIQSHLTLAANEYLQSLFENSNNANWNKTAAGIEFESQLKKSIGVRVPQKVDFNADPPGLWCKWIHVVIGSEAASDLNWCQRDSCGFLAWKINFRVSWSATFFRQFLDNLADPHLKRKSYYQVLQRIIMEDFGRLALMSLIGFVLGVIVTTLGVVVVAVRFAGRALFDATKEFT
jgi:hypothetical protein